eukprot:evm.model.NODE_44373_length_11135_cov_15.448496.3
MMKEESGCHGGGGGGGGGGGIVAIKHQKGCHCKRSHCLKKYCECYQAGILCVERKCRCLDCWNYAGSEALVKAKAGRRKGSPAPVAVATAARVDGDGDSKFVRAKLEEEGGYYPGDGGGGGGGGGGGSEGGNAPAKRGRADSQTRWKREEEGRVRRATRMQSKNVLQVMKPQMVDDVVRLLVQAAWEVGEEDEQLLLLQEEARRRQREGNEQQGEDEEEEGK